MMTDIYDMVLIGLIVVFMLLKAMLLVRKTRLGWAMAVTNLVLALAFLRTLLVVYLGWHDDPHVLMTLRVLIAVSVLWCIGELVSARWMFVRRPRNGW